MTDDLGLWLRDQRRERGWSGAEMARRIRQAGAAAGDQMPPSAIIAAYVRRWEQGVIAPTERYRLHYGRAFGLAAGQLGPRQAEREELPGADVAAGRAETGPASAGEVAAEESLTFAEWAGASNVGEVTLEQYAAQVRQLAAECEHETPDALLAGAGRLRDRLFDRLRGHQRPDQARELFLIAAQACGLMAWMYGDTGAYRVASDHAWTAWVCAEQAGHDGARALVRATQSKLAYWDGRYAESEELAGDGLRFSGRGAGQVLLGLFHARALARLGRAGEAEAALGRAGEALGRRGRDEVGGLWGASAARFHGVACEIHLWREDAGRVLGEAERAVAMFGEAGPRRRNHGAEAHARVAAAHAHLMRRDVDGVSMVLRPVLALPAERRYEPITQELGRVGRQLAAGLSGAADGRGLVEEIEAYCRDSVASGGGG
jgi:transcriptional regulator with XRE-family HTH domain